MLAQPLGECGAIYCCRGDAEHQTLLFINRGIDLMSVKQEEHFHRGMSDALVAVDERMVGHEGKAERCGLVGQRRMQVRASEGGFGLRQRRFEQPEIPNSRRATGLGQ